MRISPSDEAGVPRKPAAGVPSEPSDYQRLLRCRRLARRTHVHLRREGTLLQLHRLCLAPGALQSLRSLRLLRSEPRRQPVHIVGRERSAPLHLGRDRLRLRLELRPEGALAVLGRLALARQLGAHHLAAKVRRELGVGLRARELRGDCVDLGNVRVLRVVLHLQLLLDGHAPLLVRTREPVAALLLGFGRPARRTKQVVRLWWRHDGGTLCFMVGARDT